jgi:hypothetical protein
MVKDTPNCLHEGARPSDSTCLPAPPSEPMRAVLVLTAVFLPTTAGLTAEPVDFTRDVKPILARRCTACHGPDKQRSGLRLDSASAIRKGGNSGPVVVPGNSKASILIQAITGGEGVTRMPLKGERLGANEVSVLRAWIDAGAMVPPGEVVQSTLPRSKHWAFQPLVRSPLPAVKDIGWERNPLDRFVLARLEKENVRPSPQADRTTLLRRVHLDLLGLPPTTQEIDAFLADRAPDAYERLVDRLLASPHYGERWGRHWLDLARYADSNGYSIDSPRSIWKYRDWVINAFNKDLPFDQFVLEQLAGDLLPQAKLDQRIATGFQRNTQINEEGGIDLEQFRIEAVVDRTNTTGSVFLGLTVGCAQCHDHKFDPLSQREYYQLFAFYNSSDEPKLELATADQARQRKEVADQLAAAEKRLARLDSATPETVAAWEGKLTPDIKATLSKSLQDILAIAPNGRSPAQEAAVVAAYRKADQVRHVTGGLGSPSPFLSLAHLQGFRTRLDLEKQVVALKKRTPAITTTLVLSERKTPRTTHIHLGGDFLRKGAIVDPGVPSVLPPLRSNGRANRLDLARWLVDGRNPLPPRVTMNRFWQHYFGTGLVETENDFGTQGTPPSHPELLDWLATEFIARGWSMKAMHRLLVTSATYRQSSRSRPDLATLDPRNRLLARQTRLRLDAEVVRDIALSASGLLSHSVGGPSVFPPQPRGVYAFTQVPRDWKANDGPERYRRGLYTHFWRSAPHPGLVVFDAPDATAACTRRNRSNTPLQALTLLNDQAFFEFAQALAGRVLREGGTDDLSRIHHAFRLALGRHPSAVEQQTLVRLLRSQESTGEPGAPSAAWTTLARVLLNLDEFITRE